MSKILKNGRFSISRKLLVSKGLIDASIKLKSERQIIFSVFSVKDVIFSNYVFPRIWIMTIDFQFKTLNQLVHAVIITREFKND